MKSEFKFYFLSESQALLRAKKLQERLLEKFPDVAVTCNYENSYMVVEVESKSVDALLSVHPFFIMDEDIVGNIFYYLPLIGIRSNDDRLDGTRNSGGYVGDIVSSQNRSKLCQDNGLIFTFCRKALQEYLSMLNVKAFEYEEYWNPENKEELSKRYFPFEDVRKYGFAHMYAKHQYLYNYETYIDDDMKKFFIPLGRLYNFVYDGYVGDAYLGDYLNEGYTFIAQFSEKHQQKIVDICEKYGYGVGSGVHSRIRGMFSDELVGWEPENSYLLSVKFYPKLNKKNKR